MADIIAIEGWLKDRNGVRIAPKTLIDDVYYSDGKKAKEVLESAVQDGDVVDNVTEAIAGGPLVVPSGSVVSELKNMLTDLVKFVSFSATATVNFSANGTNYADFSIPYPAGYKYINIVTGRTSNTNVIFTAINSSNDNPTNKILTPRITYRNLASSAANSVSCYVTVAFIKDI